MEYLAFIIASLTVSKLVLEVIKLVIKLNSKKRPHLMLSGQDVVRVTIKN